MMAATDTLLNAEKFAAINYALDYADYPGAELERLWNPCSREWTTNNYGQGGVIGDEGKVQLAEVASLTAAESCAIRSGTLRAVEHPFPVSSPIVSSIRSAGNGTTSSKRM